jgi:hypothetical protein
VAAAAETSKKAEQARVDQEREQGSSSRAHRSEEGVGAGLTVGGDFTRLGEFYGVGADTRFGLMERERVRACDGSKEKVCRPWKGTGYRPWRTLKKQQPKTIVRGVDGTSRHDFDAPGYIPKCECSAVSIDDTVVPSAPISEVISTCGTHGNRPIGKVESALTKRTTWKNLARIAKRCNVPATPAKDEKPDWVRAILCQRQLTIMEVLRWMSESDEEIELPAHQPNRAARRAEEARDERARQDARARAEAAAAETSKKAEQARLDRQKRKAHRRAELDAQEKAIDAECERIRNANKALRAERLAAKKASADAWAKAAADAEVVRIARRRESMHRAGLYVVPDWAPEWTRNLRESMDAWWKKQEDECLQHKRHFRKRWLANKVGSQEAGRRIAANAQHLDRVREERAECERRWRERDAKVEADRTRKSHHAQPARGSGKAVAAGSGAALAKLACTGVDAQSEGLPLISGSVRDRDVNRDRTGGAYWEAVLRLRGGGTRGSLRESRRGRELQAIACIRPGD